VVFLLSNNELTSSVFFFVLDLVLVLFNRYSIYNFIIFYILFFSQSFYSFLAAPLAGHIDASSHWVAYVDDSTKYTVYYNEETNVSSWNPPPGGKGFRWVDVEGGEEPPKGAQETVSGMEDPEGLGADWMNTEYQAPSVDRAADYRRRVLFQAGECSLW